MGEVDRFENSGEDHEAIEEDHNLGDDSIDENIEEYDSEDGWTFSNESEVEVYAFSPSWVVAEEISIVKLISFIWRYFLQMLQVRR